MKKVIHFSILIGFISLLFCCGSDHVNKDGTAGPSSDTSALPSETAARYAYLQKEIEESKEMTPEDFAERYRVQFRDSLGHSPLEAQNLESIQSSSLSLGQEALSELDANGFVITENHNFETFFHGYEAIYKADLPVYVSADSILDAMHRSYDKILLTVESSALIPELTTLLNSMRNRLGQIDSNAMDAQARDDLDLYLTAALGLLSGQTPSPIAGADPKTIDRLLSLAQAADGIETIEIFGTSRTIDFSQYEPRGHYTDSEELSQYFRCMMWFGREDFRLVETQTDGSRVLNRRQVKAMLALRELMNEADFASYQRIDLFIESFVGESDNMQLSDIDALLADLGIHDPAELDTLSDKVIENTILKGGYGAQQIASYIIINGLQTQTLPLNASFMLFGQRYVVDSHVFSNLVYDRVQGGKELRMMPDPLDVAFAALGNDQAAALLADEINSYSYAPDLYMMRVLVDEYTDDFWNANLYNLWLDTIRTLSPNENVAETDNIGLPSTMGTETWGRRMLNTQLASWSELRHDTLLYAKQSYTGWPGCEFPDAYVDPYPEFYAALDAFAQKGKAISENLAIEIDSSLSSQIGDYFTLLSAVATTLKEMAEQQRDRVPFTEEQLTFINDAVIMKSHDAVCAMVEVPSGWYTQLFFDPEDSRKYDPVIADVHTQPADETGIEVGRILHVATGKPRMMVVTIETDTGPYAYVGPVFSYFEKTTEKWKRYTDEEWAAEISNANPEDVPWLTDLVVR